MNKKEALEVLNQALAETIRIFGNVHWQPSNSTRAQLEYLIDVLEGNSSRDRLSEIMFDIYIFREFENTHPEYAQLLWKAHKVVILMEGNEL